MQIMPSLYTETEMYKSSSNYADSSQDSSNDAFLDDLNAALSPSEDDDLEDDFDKDDDSLYKGTTEFFSAFVPEPVRFTSKELDTLSDALAADGVSIDAINAIKDMAGVVGGPSLDDLLSSIKQSMNGGNVALTEKEVGLLQSLSNRISPENPDKLYNAIRYGDSLKGLDTLTTALKSMDASLSEEEMSVIAKSLKLSDGGIMGLTQKIKNLEGKTLSSADVDNLFGDAKAEIQSKKDAYVKVEESLGKNLKPIVKSAEEREELSRQAQLRESKSVFQSRVIIEDSAVTEVIGNDLNRSDSAGTTKSEKNKENTKLKSGNDGYTPVSANTADKAVPANGADKAVPANGADKAVPANGADKAVPANGDKADFVTADKTILAGDDKKKADNAVIANILSEKTNSNSFLAIRAEESRTSDKIFNENVADSQFVAKKDAKNELNTTQEDRGNRSGKDTPRDDAQSNRTAESMRYEYAFTSVAQSYAMPPSATTPTGNALGSENALRHTNEVREQVQSTMLNMAKNGVQRIEVSLNPVELGQLNIALSIKNGEVNATIQTEKPESASMLNMQMDAIRAELENQGFKVDKIEVELGLSQEGRQEWQGMDQHNSNRENSENTEYLDRLRVINRIGSSEKNTLAQNMQNNGSMVSHTANNAMTGLHIIA